MRIVFLESTPLSELTEAVNGPIAGDRVVFLRDGQDATGDARQALEKGGVTVVRGPDLIPKDAFADMDAMLDDYLKGWFMDGGDDVSWGGALSLGRFATEYASRFVGPNAGRADEALADFIETRIGLGGDTEREAA